MNECSIYFCPEYTFLFQNDHPNKKNVCNILPTYKKRYEIKC